MTNTDIVFNARVFNAIREGHESKPMERVHIAISEDVKDRMVALWPLKIRANHEEVAPWTLGGIPLTVLPEGTPGGTIEVHKVLRIY